MNNYKLNLTRCEFSRLMRSYLYKTVDRKLWKQLKGRAIDPNTTNYEITYSDETKIACITIHSRNANNDLRFTTQRYPTLQEFVHYIFFENHMTYTTQTVSNAISASTLLGTINNNNYYESTTPTQTWDLDFDKIKQEVDKLNEENKKIIKKENKSMFNFDFGKITSDAVRISMYGIAVKNVEGHYVSYDKTSNSVMDVEILNMPAGDFLYKIPVAIKDVKSGDVVIHNRVPMFVVETYESTIKVIDIREGTEKEIYLTKSPFGFNFATKVVSLIDMTGVKADESNPFGTMLPFMLMGDNKNFDPMVLMLFNQNGGTANLTQNPMMMYFLMKDTNHKDMLPLLLMMNTNTND